MCVNFQIHFHSKIIISSIRTEELPLICDNEYSFLWRISCTNGSVWIRLSRSLRSPLNSIYYYYYYYYLLPLSKLKSIIKKDLSITEFMRDLPESNARTVKELDTEFVVNG